MKSKISPTLSDSKDGNEGYSQIYTPGQKEISLSIDKLTIAFDMPAQLTEGMAGVIYGYLKDPEFSAPHGLYRAFGAQARGYKVNVGVRVPCVTMTNGWSLKTGCLIQVGPTNPAAPYVRIDFNPDCLRPDGFKYARHILEDIIGIDWHWIQHARVTRVDAAVDVNDCSPQNWAWDIQKRRKRQLYTDGGELCTLYLGDKHGDPLVIYDKARQLKLPPEVQRTRIEFRKRRPGPVQELLGMTCPFEDLLIFDPLELPFPDPQRQAMKAVGWTAGIRGVLGLYPKCIRPKLEQDLAATGPTWWKPQMIWIEWPKMLKACLPGLFGISPESVVLVKSYASLSKEVGGASFFQPQQGL